MTDPTPHDEPQPTAAEIAALVIRLEDGIITGKVPEYEYNGQEDWAKTEVLMKQAAVALTALQAENDRLTKMVADEWDLLDSTWKVRAEVAEAALTALQARVRESALEALAAYGQAQEAHTARLEAEARVKALEAALRRIENGTTPEADPDTGELVECWMGADEMKEIASAALPADAKGE